MNTNRYTNSQLWTMVENDELKPNTVIEDNESNKFIFTGKSFQEFFAPEENYDKYVGMCKGDTWEIVGEYSEEDDCIVEL